MRGLSVSRMDIEVGPEGFATPKRADIGSEDGGALGMFCRRGDSGARGGRRVTRGLAADLRNSRMCHDKDRNVPKESNTVVDSKSRSGCGGRT